MIRDAEQASARGLTQLYGLLKAWQPKVPKRSIHLKTTQQGLLSPQQSIEHITNYFSSLFQSPKHPSTQQWTLTQPMAFTRAEISLALQSMSERKALPPGQAPAALWRANQDSVVDILYRDFAQRFGPGPLSLPKCWHQTFIALLPKPNKSPSAVEHLRPISLLPALSKILARLVAHRIRPLVAAAFSAHPQFAYILGRQTADAIDRVHSHSRQTRDRVTSLKPDVFAHKRGQAKAKLAGGIQLSLDLNKAFDRLPRCHLATALRRVGASEDVVSLVLYLHQETKMVFSREGLFSEIGTQTGIRQGCGLSPLLWACYSLMVLEKLNEYLDLSQLTAFADDYHSTWEVTEPRHFTNACAQIGRMLSDLAALGMLVSTEKTVVLISLGGRSAGAVLKRHVRRGPTGRHLLVETTSGQIRLPIKKEHSYLGIVIGYGAYERATVDHRIQQSWQAFKRIQRFLLSKSLSLNTRLRLWKVCVGSVLHYGLTTICPDSVSTNRLRTHTTRQLRLIARSPSHVTHETNLDLYRRLNIADVMHVLRERAKMRLAKAHELVGTLQPQRVHEHWKALLHQYSQVDCSSDSVNHSLTPVTQVPRHPTSCPVCGIMYPSLHAMRTHLGKQHPEQSQSYTRHTYMQRTAKDISYMQHSVQGLPQCRHCGKRFSAWLPFHGHFRQRACPALYQQPPTDTGCDTAAPSAEGVFGPGGALAVAAADSSPRPEIASVDKPLFSMTEVQAHAQHGSIAEITQCIQRLHAPQHCPICHCWCKTSAYITRHACWNHAEVKQAEPSVRKWVQARSGGGRPCKWCGSDYTQASKAHQKSCIALWMCGHLLHMHGRLADIKQTRLAFRPLQDLQDPQHGTGSPRRPGAQPGQQGAPGVRALHEEQSRGQDPAPLRVRPDAVSGSPIGAQHSPTVGGQPGLSSGDGGSTGQASTARKRGQGSTGQVRKSQRERGQRRKVAEGQLGPQPGLGPTTPKGPRKPAERLEQQLGQPAPVAGQEDLLRGRPARSPPRHGKAPAPARGLNQLLADGSRVHVVSAHCGSAQDAGRRAGREGLVRRQAAVPNSGGLAPAEECQSGGDQDHPSDHHGLLPNQHTARAHPGGREHARAPCPSAQHGDHGGQPLPVHSVEPGEAGLRQGRPSSDQLERGEGLPPVRPEASGVAKSGPSFPCPPPFGSRDADGSGSLHMGNPQSVARIPVGVPVPGEALPLRALATSGRQSPAVEAGPRPPRANDREPPEEDLGPIRPTVDLIMRLKLHNPGNHCYANSLVVATAWLHAQAGECMDPPSPLMRSALHKVFTGGDSTITLWHIPEWPQFFSHWNTQVQQDVAEFLHRMRDGLMPPRSLTQWECRVKTSAGQPAEVRDAGHFFPLPLTAPIAGSRGQQCTLQSLINHWTRQSYRRQASVYAALSAPTLLVLQVARFNDRGNKVKGNVTPPGP